MWCMGGSHSALPWVYMEEHTGKRMRLSVWHRPNLLGSVGVTTDVGIELGILPVPGQVRLLGEQVGYGVLRGSIQTN